MIQLASGDLCSCTKEGFLSIWNYLTGQELKSFQLRPELNIFDVYTLLILSDERVCISCETGDGTDCTFIYDFDTEECEQVLDGPMRQMTKLNDGILCCASDDDDIIVWS
jgi:hypothetical protein